jgi:hypothetical protein
MTAIGTSFRVNGSWSTKRFSIITKQTDYFEFKNNNKVEAFILGKYNLVDYG